MSITTTIINAKENLKKLYENDKLESLAEDKILGEASFELSTFENLQLESNIQSKRDVRRYVIQKQEERIRGLQVEYNDYIISLKAKEVATRDLRRQKSLELWEKANQSRIKLFNNKKYLHLDTVIRYYYPSGSWNSRNPDRDSGGSTYISGNILKPDLKLNWLTPVPIGEETLSSSSRTTYITDFGIPLEQAYDVMWQAYQMNKPLSPTEIKEIEKFLSIDFINNYGVKTFGPLPYNKEIFRGVSPNLSSRINIDKLVQWFFPFVREYEANASVYPYASGFAEEVSWPNSKQLHLAARKVMKIGSYEWAEKQLEHLKEISSFNMKDDEAIARYKALAVNDKVTSIDWEKVLRTKTKVLAIPNGYVDPDTQNFVSVPYRNFIESTEVDPNIDPATKYYSPREKENFLYVPGFDYINPLEYVAYKDREKQVNTPEGDYLDAVQKEIWAQQKAMREQRNALFKQRISALARGGYTGMIFNPGALIEVVACAGYGEDSKVCSAVKDIASVSRGLVKLWVGAAVSYVTGGVAAGIAGAVSAVATDPALGIGKTDIGKIILALGEAYAIANVTNSAIDKALTEVLENQIFSITKREIGKHTGLDRTLLGRVGLDLTTGAAFGMYKDKNFMDAMTGSADKAWRLSVARENPYGAMLLAGVTEIEKNGWKINSTNPMDWFDNISVGEEFTRIRRSIKGKDIAKIIGITYMTSSGMISEGDALLMVGQEASKRNLERFYHDKPLNEDPEMAAYREKRAEVNRWKHGITVMQKLSTGVPPTKEDVMVITDNVAGPIYDRIKSLGLPTSVEVNLWKIAVTDIGLPNMAQYTPDVSFTLPDWMKSSKSDGHVVITNKEKMEEALQKEFTEKTDFTREDLVQIILGMFPRNVPLLPLSTVPVAPTFNWIDTYGSLKIRDPLVFPFDHPMLNSGVVKKKYTPKQTAYLKAREQELIIAKNKMRELQNQLNMLDNLQSGTNLA